MCSVAPFVALAIGGFVLSHSAAGRHTDLADGRAWLPVSVDGQDLLVLANAYSGAPERHVLLAAGEDGPPLSNVGRGPAGTRVFAPADANTVTVAPPAPGADPAIALDPPADEPVGVAAGGGLVVRADSHGVQAWTFVRADLGWSLRRTGLAAGDSRVVLGPIAADDDIIWWVSRDDDDVTAHSAQLVAGTTDVDSFGLDVDGDVLAGARIALVEGRATILDAADRLAIRLDPAGGRAGRVPEHVSVAPDLVGSLDGADGLVFADGTSVLTDAGRVDPAVGTISQLAQVGDNVIAVGDDTTVLIHGEQTEFIPAPTERPLTFTSSGGQLWLSARGASGALAVDADGAVRTVDDLTRPTVSCAPDDFDCAAVGGLSDPAAGAADDGSAGAADGDARSVLTVANAAAINSPSPTREPDFEFQDFDDFEDQFQDDFGDDAFGDFDDFQDFDDFGFEDYYDDYDYDDGFVDFDDYFDDWDDFDDFDDGVDWDDPFDDLDPKPVDPGPTTTVPPAPTTTDAPVTTTLPPPPTGEFTSFVGHSGVGSIHFEGRVSDDWCGDPVRVRFGHAAAPTLVIAVESDKSFATGPITPTVSGTISALADGCDANSDVANAVFHVAPEITAYPDPEYPIAFGESEYTIFSSDPEWQLKDLEIVGDDTCDTAIDEHDETLTLSVDGSEPDDHSDRVCAVELTARAVLLDDTDTHTDISRVWTMTFTADPPPPTTTTTTSTTTTTTPQASAQLASDVRPTDDNAGSIFPGVALVLGISALSWAQTGRSRRRPREENR